MIGWAIEALIASGALMALVLAIRLPVRRAFGPDVAYALWALPVLRLMLPPIPQMLPQVVRHATVTPVAQASERVTILLPSPARGAAQVAAQAFDWTMLAAPLAAVWLLGAVAFAGFHILTHRRFCRGLLEAAEPIDARGGIDVIETPAARGPLAFGIWRRYVAFPSDFGERYDAAERDLALAHELGHHARGDLVANWIALAVLALHWFNPLAWAAFRAFRTDQEVANDARVLAGRPAITRHTYACAILKAAYGGAVSAACHLHTIDDLKGRLRMLTTRRISRVRLAGGAATVALVGVVTLGLTASGTQAAEHVRAKVRTVTGVDLDHIPSMAAMPALAASLPTVGIEQVAAATHRPDIYVEPPRIFDVPAESAQSPAIFVEPPRVPDAPVAPKPPVAPRTMIATDRIEATDAREMRHHTVRISDDGIVTDDRFANMPRVTSTDCGGGDRPMVINTTRDGKRRITICNDRIEKAAARGAQVAANSVEIERNAYRSALNGLRNARATVIARGDMPAEGRREALAAIDESIVEIETDIAHAD